MQRTAISLAMLLLPAALAPAQQPAPSTEQMLNYVLGNWELAMTRLDSFAVTCRRTTKDTTFNSVESYEGFAKFLKGQQGQPSRALLRMENKRDPKKYEQYLYTGLYLYEWVPATKVVNRHGPYDRKPGQLGVDDNIVSLLFGMKAADAKRRYHMTWVPDTRDNNKYYHYIRILPRLPQDKADFTEARLTLTSRDFLPAQVWYHQPNRNTVQWDFEGLQKNAPIPATVFAPPALPDRTWRVEAVPSQIAPAGGVAPLKK